MLEYVGIPVSVRSPCVDFEFILSDLRISKRSRMAFSICTSVCANDFGGARSLSTRLLSSGFFGGCGLAPGCAN